MRVEPGESVSNVKFYDEGENMRLTFGWPVGIEQVYIFAEKGDFDITQASPSDGKLFTLQEYKKQAGYVRKKRQGQFTYYIFPFLRENGEDVLYAGEQITVTGRTFIGFSIREKTGRHKNHEIKLTPSLPVPPGVIAYVKKKNSFPEDINDGVFYSFGEALEQPVVRIVRTELNEFLRLFVADEELYELILFSA